MRLSRLAAIAALGLGLVLLTYLSVATADVLAQTPTAATPRATPGTPATPARAATPSPATAVATPRPATVTVAATPTRAVTPVTPARVATVVPSPPRTGFGGSASGGGLDGQYVTALWVVGWGLVTLGSLYLVLRRRRA